MFTAASCFEVSCGSWKVQLLYYKLALIFSHELKGLVQTCIEIGHEHSKFLDVSERQVVST